MLFCEFIKGYSVTTIELYLLAKKLTENQSVTDAWKKAVEDGFSLSLAAAHQWYRRFTQQLHRLRSTLAIMKAHPPPPSEKVIASPNQDIAITIETFDEANWNVTNDPFAAFQLQLQTPLF